MEALLKNPKVRMRDQKAVEAKIAKIVADGSENLIVISDFDYTLSRYKDTSGSICSSSHGVFHSAADKADHVLAEKLNRSKAKFMAVETCHIMTIDEKIPHMVEWWNTSHECIKEAKLHKDVIEEIVLDSKSMIVLRDRAIEFFELLQAKSVPLVIFSAGVGTVIDIFLRPRLTKHQMNNVHIISNMMIFDEEGICVDFSEPLIHVFCKNGSAVRHDDPFFHSFSTRQNVVLLGDSTGDLEMHVGVERSGVVLKIGFLNHKFEELLDKYLAEGAYDIVIVDDQSVDIPLALLSEVPTTELSNKTDDDVTNSNKESSKAVENKAPSVAFFLCIRVLPLTSIRGVAPAGFTGQQGSSQRNRSGWLTERYCDIQLSRLQKRQALEEVGELKLCLYVLDEDIERATSPEEEEEGDDRRRKERPKTTTVRQIGIKSPRKP
ncbi:hypothetical protein QR680_017340 [Steinernema hermaphroditum]|uniref:5'-nucleotidase n=1 Tax=Steinernema hermaphroditum TaxID=289476 RepID=A0AA39LNY7_9BILA|nr:hypothetical protein QR680_017340 [Steinernema hermaphroditum]